MSHRIAWLVYRKLRPAFGIPFAFVLISGAFVGVVDYRLLLAASGFLLVDLFGNFYNDYWDFEEDLKNGRKDKFTTSGLITPKESLYISFGVALGGLFLLSYTAFVLAGLGISYLFLLFIYSHRNVRLKGNVLGYSLVSFPFALLPVVIANIGGLPAGGALPLSLFFYFQCMYILCQKDSTDLKDEGNLFVRRGWKKSFAITALFASLSSLSLFLISVFNPAVFAAWGINFAAKVLNLNHIRIKSITRQKRSNFVLMEYISHYLSLGGAMLA